MNVIAVPITNEIIYATGWTLVHSLWQSTLIALVIALSYAFTKTNQANIRYWINTLGLFSCFIASVVTFYLNFHAHINTDIITNNAINIIPNNYQTANTKTLSDFINHYLIQIVLFWLIGFSVYITKYCADFFYSHRIRQHHNSQPTHQLLNIFIELKTSLGISKDINLRISKIVDIPCVIGHFKPVILLPASLLSGLSVKQIEVILLHELGHISRNDYLVNSVQAFITSIYFFNPLTRWISFKIDEERENACDDIAIAVSGDPLFYANTLKEFAEMKNNYSPAVAMTGRKNLLINRIKRLFFLDASFSKTYGKAITIMAIFLLMIGYSIVGYSEEKKTTTDTFSVKLENEPLSNLVKLVEGYCPNTQGKIKLKHPDQPISGSFPELECNTVEQVIRSMDNGLDSTLTGISINEKDIALKNLITKLEAYCPEIKGKIALNNPETLAGFKTENLICASVEPAIKSMDKNEKGQSTTIGKISKIEYKEPNEYEKAFYKELSFPKEIMEKGYVGDCTLTFIVGKNGLAKDITPICISPNNEQKQYFEKLISETTQKIKFPIKMDNGKAVIAKGISIKVVWRK